MGPSVEILNQMASNISKAEAFQNDIVLILNSLNTSDLFEVRIELTPDGESQLHCSQRQSSHTTRAHKPSAKFLARIRPEPSAPQEHSFVSSSLTARYNREDLYERVWTVLMTKLAKQYEVSDVALAKACRKLSIPLPGRGYWAKKDANRPVGPRPPLPTVAIRTAKPSIEEGGLSKISV